MRLGPYALIVAVVVGASALCIFGVFDPNPILTMSGLAVGVKGGVLAGRPTIDPGVGLMTQALGHVAALDLLHGTIPWWNPYEGIGAPLAGNMQFAALFPPTLLLGLPDGVLAFYMLLQGIAGMATYRLLVRLGVSRWVAAGGGCAFAVNGTFAWMANPAANPIAFLPLILLGVERIRAASREGRGGSFGLVAVGLALSVYAGVPETAYLDGLLAVVWTAVRIPGLRRGAPLVYARKLGAGLLAGALLAAPILVAFGDYLPGAYLGPNGGQFNAEAVPGPGAGALFFPYIAGPLFGFTPGKNPAVLGAFWIDIGGYLTTNLLVLTLIGLWSRRLRPLRLGLAVWIALALGRSYGVGPLQRLFDALPLMSRVEAFRYVTPSVELAFVVLAFLAIDDLRRGDVPGWFAGAAVLLAVGCALVTLGVGHRLVDAVTRAPQSHAWLDWSLAWGFGAMAAVAVVAVTLRGRLGALVLAAFVVVEACAMFVVPELAAPQCGQLDVAFVQWAQSHVGTGRLFTVGGLLGPNYGSYFGVQEADVNGIPLPEVYARLIKRQLDPTTLPDYFDGTTIVATHQKRASGGPSPETPVQAMAGNLAEYEAIGVGYVAAYAGSSDAAQMAALGLPRVYGDRYAEVFRLPHAAPMYSAEAPDGGCKLSRQRVNSVTVDCRQRGVLIRRELAMAGWSASANGRSLAVRRHDSLFQAVTVGSGTSVVRFSFAPPHEGLALWALVVGAAAIVASGGPAAAWPLAIRRATLRRVHARRTEGGSPGGEYDKMVSRQRPPVTARQQGGSRVTMRNLIDPGVSPSGTGCVECLAADGWWFHLRRCTACGHIGCCDSSPSQHASAHARAEDHWIITSFEPGEDWFYDYRTEGAFEGPALAPPEHHPLDQPTPGPAGRVPRDWMEHLH